MIALNHALTGALIGLSLQRPLLAIPAALVSHFVCDAIPHYGAGGNTETQLRSGRFALQLVADAGLCFGLVLVLALMQPAFWIVAVICAFAAAAPDFAWMPSYVRLKRGQNRGNERWGRLMRFAADIQWFERPIGGFVELAWAVGTITLLVAYL